MSEDIIYKVEGQIATITFNLPNKLNALNGDQYLTLAKYIDKANKEPNTVITLLKSTGRYFSAGANFNDKNIAMVQDGSDQTKYWLSNFVARNVYLTTLFYEHKKVLVAALNGPVVGLTAALVSLCDLIYGINEDIFLLVPFSNLGLVCEGGVSASLFHRLGFSVANEALLFAKPIGGKDLLKTGYLNKIYGLKDTEEFNSQVLKDLEKLFKGLNQESILDNKELLKHNYLEATQGANSREAIKGFEKWMKGIPQDRFLQLSKKNIKHKL